jgi:hypothetical protein
VACWVGLLGLSLGNLFMGGWRAAADTRLHVDYSSQTELNRRKRYEDIMTGRNYGRSPASTV